MIRTLLEMAGTALGVRASPENPTTNLADPAAWLVDWMGGGSTYSGKAVSPDNALQITAVYACVRILSEAVGSIPVRVYRERDDGGKDRQAGHPVEVLLNREYSAEVDAMVGRVTTTAGVLLWGNGYAQIVKRGDGTPVEMVVDQMQPWRVEPIRSASGELVYKVTQDGGVIRLARRNVFHLPGLSFNGVRGMSPIGLARQTLGTSLAAEEYGARFFGSGGRPSGVLKHPGELSAKAAARIRNEWRERHGGIAQAGQVAVLEEGMDFQAISIPPEEAQFLASRKYGVADVARIYRVPLHMLAELDRATFSNIGEQGLEFVTYSLRTWLKAWEQQSERKLLTPAERAAGFRVEHDVMDLLRGDTKTRGEFYLSMRQAGAMNADEIRAREGLNPVPDDRGSVFLNPLNLAPAPTPGQADELIQAQIAKAQGSGQGGGTDGGSTDGTDGGGTDGGGSGGDGGA